MHLQTAIAPTSQSRKIAFGIRVKPHIKKFLDVKYGQKLCLNQKSTIGFILSKVFLKNTLDASRKLDDSFSEVIVIEVAKHDVFKNSYRHLTDKSILDFHNACQQLFIDQLCTHVSLRRELVNDTINSAICSFMDKYNITENECKLESLQKAYYREGLK